VHSQAVAAATVTDANGNRVRGECVLSGIRGAARARAAVRRA
jgi:hypothetical protein